MDNNETEAVFHFVTLKFTTYKSKEFTSNQILREIFSHIRDKKTKGEGILIDKHKNRTDNSKREIFINSVREHRDDHRTLCKMALIRAGKEPMVKPDGEFELVPLTKTKGQIAEETHFFVDYSKVYPVLCVEYNHYGPRMSDIEFYLRHLAKDLRIAYALEVTIHMNISIDKVLENLKQVLNLNIKMNPKKLSQIDAKTVGKYFTGMANLRQNVNPEFIRLMLYFQKQGGGQISPDNQKGNQMVRYLLNLFKQNSEYTEKFEDFVIDYENKDGIDETFNLIKGKKEITKMFDVNMSNKSLDWYNLIVGDLNKALGDK